MRSPRSRWWLLVIAATWITDFDLFAAWGLTVRNHASGIVFTGLVIAGFGSFRQPLLGSSRPGQRTAA